MERKDYGYIMQLQNFSVNDGEGIRTTIFMAGCPLSCIWCCNPENKCAFNEEHKMTLDEVEKKISRQALFFRKCEGGITFSGGEATLQTGFLRAMAEKFYDKGYSLAIETCGYFDFDSVSDILEKMDLIFLDLKLMSSEHHKMFTGVSNNIILENAKRIHNEIKTKLVIRIPVIKGVNGNEKNIRETCQFIHENLPGASLELLPYHKFGIDKYKELNIDDPDVQYEKLKKIAGLENSDTENKFEFSYEMETPTEEEIMEYKKIADSFGVLIVSYR